MAHQLGLRLIVARRMTGPEQRAGAGLLFISPSRWGIAIFSLEEVHVIIRVGRGPLVGSRDETCHSLRSAMRLRVLYEDNHLLAVDKPACLATMGARADQPSLWLEAKAYLKQKYNKPGNVYLGVVSRLDALVTGVVIFARTSKSAARLSAQFRDREVEKTYWALTERPPRPSTGTWTDWLRHEERERKVLVVSANDPDAQEARLSYRTLHSASGATLVEIGLETGRKHQIRVQLAHHGCPILGDFQYGAKGRFPTGIALHASRLELTHPILKTRLIITAPCPPTWQSYIPPT